MFPDRRGAPQRHRVGQAIARAVDGARASRRRRRRVLAVRDLRDRARDAARRDRAAQRRRRARGGERGAARAARHRSEAARRARAARRDDRRPDGAAAGRRHPRAVRARGAPAVPARRRRALGSARAASRRPRRPTSACCSTTTSDDVERLVFVLQGADRSPARAARRARPRADRAAPRAHAQARRRQDRAARRLHQARRADARRRARCSASSTCGSPARRRSRRSTPLRVWADDVAATREQLALFATKPRRDLRAADEALARVRAELGDDAVVRAVLRDGHLPEASFGWERLVHVVRGRAVAASACARSCAGCSRARSRCRRRRGPRATTAGCSSGLEHGAVVRIVGPYVVSGGWWAQRAPPRVPLRRARAAAIACGSTTTATAGAGSARAPSSDHRQAAVPRFTRSSHHERRSDVVVALG